MIARKNIIVEFASVYDGCAIAIASVCEYALVFVGTHARVPVFMCTQYFSVCNC